MNKTMELKHDEIVEQISTVINKLKSKKDRDATFAKIGPIDVLFMRINEKKVNCCPKTPSEYWAMDDHDEFEKIFDSMGIMFSGATKGNMLAMAFNMVEFE